MHRLISLFIVCAIGNSIPAQDIKLMDYAPQYAKHKVSERKAFEIKSVNGKQDTCIQGLAMINEKGYPVHYTEYFARGRKMAEYAYEYDGTGKLIRHSVMTAFNDWQPIEFKLTFDNKGRLASRELPESISSFWIKETFHYNNAGVMIKNEHWYEKEGSLALMDYQDYPSSLQTEESSLTYINNPKGLLMLHQWYNSNGKVDKYWKYEYSYR